MFGVVVLIFFVLESVEPTCLDVYSQLTNSPISSSIISGTVLEIPSRYYANCSAVTSVNLNAVEKKVKLNSLDFVKYFPSSVTYLDASNNRIIELPQLVNAVHLTSIILTNNKINDITYINQFRYLQLIDFAENKIKNLPKITLSNLKQLILRKNLIKSVRPWNLRASPNLVTLQFDENLLTEFRICEFNTKISISVTNNAIFFCPNVLCNVCICKDQYGSVERGREIDACPEDTELYFIATAIVVLVLFSGVALICVIRWKRRMNRRIQEESQDRNLLSANSMPLTPMTPPPKYELGNYQHGQVVGDVDPDNSPGNVPNYDYVYDHFRRKRHFKPQQPSNPW